MQLISDALAEVLMAQWAHEISNSHLYIYIMAFLKNKGLGNISKLFEHQYKEEREHADIILSLMTDLGADFMCPEIDSVSIPISSISDIATAYINREIETTKSLESIRDMASDESCGVVEQRIREMILLQQAEYAEATDFVDKTLLLGDDWKSVMLWDAGME